MQQGDIEIMEIDKESKNVKTTHDKVVNVERIVIPPITDPLGRYWKQPKVSDIEIDNNHALMEEETLDQLMEYSCSQPTGVYVGKMWKSKTYDGRWILRWFGYGESEDYCSNRSRSILVV